MRKLLDAVTWAPALTPIPPDDIVGDSMAAMRVKRAQGHDLNACELYEAHAVRTRLCASIPREGPARRRGYGVIY
jgi:hypothetical protein